MSDYIMSGHPETDLQGYLESEADAQENYEKDFERAYLDPGNLDEFMRDFPFYEGATHHLHNYLTEDENGAGRYLNNMYKQWLRGKIK